MELDIRNTAWDSVENERERDWLRAASFFVSVTLPVDPGNDSSFVLILVVQCVVNQPRGSRRRKDVGAIVGYDPPLH
jgi:hypothetical protein